MDIKRKSTKYVGNLMPKSNNSFSSFSNSYFSNISLIIGYDSRKLGSLFFILFKILVSKKFALLKKPVNPSRFRTHPAVPELSALCIILAVFLKGGKNVSADSA